MYTIAIIERIAEDGSPVRGPETPLPLGLPLGDGGDHYIVYEPGDTLPDGRVVEGSAVADGGGS